MFVIDGVVVELDMVFEWVVYWKDLYVLNKRNVFWMDIWEEKEVFFVREWFFVRLRV